MARQKLSNLQQNPNNVKMENVIMKGKNSGEKKESNKTVSMLANLAQRLEKSRLSAAATPSLDTFVQGVKELLPQLAMWGKEIGTALAAENVQYLKDAIRAQELDAIAIVDEVRRQNTASGREAALAYVGALLAAMPEDKQAWALGATQGRAPGLFWEAGEKQQGAWLPVMDESGRWNAKKLRSAPEAGGLLNHLNKIQQKLSSAEREADNAHLAEVQKGTTGILLEVLEKGQGIAAFPVPPETITVRGETKVLKGLRSLKIEVKNGKIFPLDACGDAEWLAQKAMKLGISIPAANVTCGRLELDEYFERELYNAMQSFHGLCHRGWKKAKKAADEASMKAQAEANLGEFKAKATVTARQWFLEEAVGTAYIWLKSWTIGYNAEAKTFWGIHALVERDNDGNICVSETLGGSAVSVFGDKFAKFANPGAKFTGIEYPLSSILRTCYGMVQREDENNKGDGLPGNGEAQAKERELEAEAEREAQRAKIAKAEAERLGLKADEEADGETISLTDVFEPAPLGTVSASAKE